MSKSIFLGVEARKQLQTGIDKLASAVKCTLGPKGKNVVIDKGYPFAPVSTKDGVTVAKQIDLSDPIENTGALMLKEVAMKTMRDAGDGTTTATVLAQAIITAGLKNVAAGANPIDLKRGIDKAVSVVVENLKTQSVEVADDKDKILNIATISANNDEEIGKLIADVMAMVDNKGIIKVQESRTPDSYIEQVDGMEFNRGLLSPLFINNPAKMVCELTDCHVLILDKKMSIVPNAMVQLMGKVVNNGLQLLIIALEMDGECLSSIIGNKMGGRLKAAVVRVPGVSPLHQTQLMDDIAAITGATIISDERNLPIDKLSMDHLGKANSIVVDEKSTKIIGGVGSDEAIQARITQITSLLSNTNDDREVSFLKERLGMLTGKVGMLFVGAASEVEMGEKKDRVDDALCATRAAVEEGVIPGGGVAYIRAIDSLDYLIGINEDEKTGIEIIRKALESPLKTIVENSGGAGDVVVNKVREGQTDFGYNARTEVYENLIAAGVIDPTKVARVALLNAASVASIILTTECLLVEEPDKEKK